MEYIDTHAHMISRNTADYQQLAMSGCAALVEPVFWTGWNRLPAASTDDPFQQLTRLEPKRPGQYGVRHYTYLSLNARDGVSRELAREVLKRIPSYLEIPTVLGIGEIGLNRNTAKELAIFEECIELASDHNQLILIHTPDLEDKYKGTKLILRALRSFQRLDPRRVMIDHAEEHTVEMIRDNGFQCGLTLCPATKVSYARAVDILEVHGTAGIYVNSACYWSNSIPVAIPHFIQEMRRRHHTERTIRKVVYENPNAFLAQSPKFHLALTSEPELTRVSARTT
ncbi:MAG: TatD family hydrolase [Acidobacteriaceae bacterium]